MADATMTSPALKQLRKTWHKGTWLWHMGLVILVCSFIMQFIVIGTNELIVGSTEEIGCVRPESKCEDIYNLYQLIQAFGVIGVFMTLLAMLLQAFGIARRGSCYITILSTMVVGLLAMGSAMVIWAVAVGLKNNTFCSDSFPVLPQVSRADYKYGASFTIAVIGWIFLVLYLINQLILIGVVSSHAKEQITEQAEPAAEEQASA